jgi:hypothetical protein
MPNRNSAAKNYAIPVGQASACLLLNLVFVLAKQFKRKQAEACSTGPEFRL